MNTSDTAQDNAPASEEDGPQDTGLEKLPSNEGSVDSNDAKSAGFCLLDRTVEQMLESDEKLEQVKDLGSLKEAKRGKFWMEGVMYRDVTSDTLWMVTGGRWKCAVCSDSRYLCRGCGGMGSKYPQLFGCCSMSVFCPNCVTLTGPRDDHRVVGDCKVVGMHVDSWDNRHLHQMDGANIVSFKPMTERCFLVVKK